MHIRFEDNSLSTSPYAFGFVLKTLTLRTTNEIWEAEFIDRTDEANRERPLHKHLKVFGFAFYWKPAKATMLSVLKSPREIEGKLNESEETAEKENYILKPCNFHSNGSGL